MNFRFLLAILACYRLSILVSEDDGPGDIFRKLRQWTDSKRLAEQSQQSTGWVRITATGLEAAHRGKWANIDDGLNCPYCVGVWVAALLIPLVYSGIGDPILLWLGIAGGQSLLQDLRKE